MSPVNGSSRTGAAHGPGRLCGSGTHVRARISLGSRASFRDRASVGFRTTDGVWTGDRVRGGAGDLGSRATVTAAEGAGDGLERRRHLARDHPERIPLTGR